MFGSHGIQPVTVVFNNSKNCFLQLPSKLISQLSLRENQVVELSWSNASPVFLSWTPNRSSSSYYSNEVELSRQLGEKLGLQEGEHGFLKPCYQVSSVHQVHVEPLSSDDWEILELHSSALEQQLLNQIRVVFQNAVFPVWVDSHTVIYIHIGSLSPSVPYGHLEQFTELVVSPKTRSDVAAGRLQSPLSRPDFVSPSESVPSSQQWGGIADLKSFVRYMFKSTHEPETEMPAVPQIPSILRDSLHRVCGSPPSCLRTMSHVATDVLHLFSPRQPHNNGLAGAQSLVTYGLISKVPSPREVKGKTKLAQEKKKTSVAEDTSTADAQAEGEVEGQVVRVISHGLDYSGGNHGSHCKSSVCSGEVWIPDLLAKRLNIVPHSIVRIKPVKSEVKVATSVHLQPLKPLLEEDDEEIQTVFLSWLHNQSHEPLVCLTPRSGTILLHGADAKAEFAVTVVNPADEQEASDQLFLLAPSVLQKKDVQVAREPLTSPTEAPQDEAEDLELPSVNTLGGINELSDAGAEFISHSLLGSPLSRELCTAGVGLRAGALLITGPKGSGKSTLSRALCRNAKETLDSHVEIVDCKKLQGKRAETVRQLLRDIFAQAQWKQPSVVLLDDLDQMAGAATSPEHELGPEALLHLHIAQSLRDVVDELVVHGSLVCLIITSLSEHSLHPSLTEVQGSHFIQRFVHLKTPDQAQRAEVLRCMILRRSGVSEETLRSLDLPTVAKETEGYLPRDLGLLLERAIHANAAHRAHSDNALCLSLRDFEQAIKGFTPPSLWGVDLHTPGGVGLERVGGLTEVRQQLMDTILLPAKYPVLFANLPIRHRSGVLLYGAPGTGKTLLARAVAKDSGMNFISIKGPELLSKYIGASEQGVRDVFQRAQAAKPCILFFDEFDSLAPRRGHDSTGVTDRVVNQLLTQLDGVEGLQGVYVLAATSRPDLIDPALLRPGRLDKSLYCPPPDLDARLEILKALSAGVPLAPDVDLEQLAAATEKFTGADLKALLYNAQLEAVHCSLGSPHDPAGASDCEMSLSSMMFPNHSSGSDDSAGDAEGGSALEQSMVLVENEELHSERPHSRNVWRLYFGSSYESESPVSGSNSHCASGPSSINQECAATVREPGRLLPPVYMSSLRGGVEELSPEQLERLRQDTDTIRKSHSRGKDLSLHTRPASSQPRLSLAPAHLDAALVLTRPSLSAADWRRYQKLYESFGGSEGRNSSPPVTFTPGAHVTLA
ncbi:peroxisome biogenesis factor 1 [Synchiropus splendidus]|uniref:peroxisome biogenesis factor 1 n=1 Tax=Synchiropus splendidus TaxID=270530 RepID=UPI00237DA1A4|nr:peroxisome biogenesis factor 1 [Synchiropus splendidus]